MGTHQESTSLILQKCIELFYFMLIQLLSLLELTNFDVLKKIYMTCADIFILRIHRFEMSTIEWMISDYHMTNYITIDRL